MQIQKPQVSFQQIVHKVAMEGGGGGGGVWPEIFKNKILPDKL